MFRIGRMPRYCKSFFVPLRDYFHRPAWRHFQQLVLAMTIGTTMTLERLAALLQETTHRTNHGEFLWRSDWDESAVLQAAALRQLRWLRRGARSNEPCYLIFDDTPVEKFGRTMDGLMKTYHSASKRWMWGHLIVKAALFYRGVTIPWATHLYLNWTEAQRLGRPLVKRTDWVAQVIREASLPAKLKVVVLFDAFYLSRQIARAVNERGWTYVSMGKRNQRFTPDTQPHGPSRSLGRYGRNLLRRRGRWGRVSGIGSTHAYRLASQTGRLRGFDAVQIVASRRRDHRPLHVLVTNDRRAAARVVLDHYLKRWTIELLIKDQKQHLGLGDYRVLRYRAVVRHLHLVDLAYACLTHAAVTSRHAQGQVKTSNVLRLPTVSQLKVQMRQAVWQEVVEQVIKKSHERAVVRRLERLIAA